MQPCAPVCAPQRTVSGVPRSEQRLSHWLFHQHLSSGMDPQSTSHRWNPILHFHPWSVSCFSRTPSVLSVRYHMTLCSPACLSVFESCLFFYSAPRWTFPMRWDAGSQLGCWERVDLNNDIILNAAQHSWFLHEDNLLPAELQLDLDWIILNSF